MSNADSRFTPVKEAPGSDGAAKFWIKSLDTGLTVSAQFNPKELQIDRAVPWSPPGEAGKENSKGGSKGGIDLEFTGAKGRSLTVELLFDEYESQAGDRFKVSVAERVRDLETLASVREPGAKKEDLRRPHWCVCSWGSAMKRFQCVIENISTKYTMFDTDGTPLRATVTLKLTEADSVSAQKEGGGAAPGGGAATGGKG
jgi:hypothetical protein